ncbi:STAS domain-containing protein [Bdellovibrio bacteriovorus]|uniref:STAS domain-containing protein n=1 Tax=Bdellovibrio bacteriovorus TaxID=959 RepID=UPI000B28D902|nr:STAS domain-containing protein [Bdellovibrio bacteriovorus]
MEDQKSFQYAFNQRNNMLVVSLTGEITSQVVPALEACRQELLGKKDFSRVVIYFQDVDAISLDAVPVLAQMQREIRAKPADLRLASLRESLKEKLIRMGVVRGLEVADDLKTALLSF